MPDTEQAVLEAPIVEAAESVETPEAPVIEPEAPEVAPVEEPALDLSVLKKLSAAELRTVLAEAEPDAVAEIEAELEKRVEQRVQTRAKEADTAEHGRHQYYQQHIELGKQAQADLEMRARRFKNGDTEAFSEESVIAAIDAYRNGALANLALENEQSLAPVRDQFLPKPTADELAVLEKALYEDRRSGKLTQIPVLMELVAARARAEGIEEGTKKGESNRKAKEALAERLQKVQEVKNQAPGVVPEGTAAPAVMSVAAFNALSLDEQEKIPARERARIYANGR